MSQAMLTAIVDAIKNARSVSRLRQIWRHARKNPECEAYLEEIREQLRAKARVVDRHATVVTAVLADDQLTYTAAAGTRKHREYQQHCGDSARHAIRA